MSSALITSRARHVIKPLPTEPRSASAKLPSDRPRPGHAPRCDEDQRLRLPRDVDTFEVKLSPRCGGPDGDVVDERVEDGPFPFDVERVPGLAHVASLESREGDGLAAGFD